MLCFSVFIWRSTLFYKITWQTISTTIIITFLLFNCTWSFFVDVFLVNVFFVNVGIIPQKMSQITKLFCWSFAWFNSCFWLFAHLTQKKTMKNYEMLKWKFITTMRAQLNQIGHSNMFVEFKEIAWFESRGFQKWYDRMWCANWMDCKSSHFIDLSRMYALFLWTG